MPAVQRGRVEKLPSGRWSVRFYDEHGARKRQGGFDTKTAARQWVDNRAKEVAALRRGDPVAARRQTIPTLDDLCDEFLATQCGAEHAPGAPRVARLITQDVRSRPGRQARRARDRALEE